MQLPKSIHRCNPHKAPPPQQKPTHNVQNKGIYKHKTSTKKKKHIHTTVHTYTAKKKKTHPKSNTVGGQGKVLVVLVVVM